VAELSLQNLTLSGEAVNEVGAHHLVVATTP
jgi:hypothetical protein